MSDKVEPGEKAREIARAAFKHLYYGECDEIEGVDEYASIIQIALDEAEKRGAEIAHRLDRDLCPSCHYHYPDCVLGSDGRDEQIENLTAERDRYREALSAISLIGDAEAGIVASAALKREEG